MDDLLVGRHHHFRTDREALTIFENDPLEFEPGTRVNYSTYGFSLLAAALGGAAGAPYQQVIRDVISRPLGLGSVSADYPLRSVPHRLAFYVYRQDIGETIHAGFTDNSYKWAGGGYVSNTEDLARFASALLEPGFLTRESLTMMFTPQRVSSGDLAASGGAPVGIGWRVDEDAAQRPRFHHGGSLTGGGAVVLALRNERAEWQSQRISFHVRPRRWRLVSQSCLQWPPGGFYRVTKLTVRSSIVIGSSP